MESTPDDRLAVILKAYTIARDQQDSDIAEAGSDEEADAVRSNLASLQLAYLRAERSQLDSNGAGVEAAYQSARSATDEVARAYRNGAALADRIRAVSGAVTAVASLAAKASALA
ncbi:MAG TPA: hypothetical protein VFQ67_07135 [Allosphingosinicella sp.]|jgi:hypothetical protein|nr:hypothetical protein [Allosphingosinicella sp.]